MQDANISTTFNQWKSSRAFIDTYCRRFTSLVVELYVSMRISFSTKSIVLVMEPYFASLLSLLVDFHEQTTTEIGFYLCIKAKALYDRPQHRPGPYLMSRPQRL